MLASLVFSAVIATVTGTASVIDADTIEIRGERIRLVGVDAPESGQKCLDAYSKFFRCGTVAANALDAWISRASVTCDIEGKDRYGRLLGECRLSSPERGRSNAHCRLGGRDQVGAGLSTLPREGSPPPIS